MFTEQIDEDGNKPYVIVLFLPKKAPEVEEIEIVPSAWLTSNKKHCRYPLASDYQHVAKWAKELKKCQKSWHLHEVEILAYATISVSENHNHQSSASDVQQAAIVPGSNFRQLMVALDREEEEAIAKMDPLLQPLQKDIEILIRKQTLNIRNYIDSSKRSIMYDVTRNTHHLQIQIIANSQNKSPVPTASLVEIKKNIDDSLPISDLEAFKKFDESLTLENKNKYESFLNLIRVCTFGQTEVVDCLHKIFPEILKKAVEINYSGTGKKVHGVGKLNFSSTNTYQCIESVIREKFPDKPQTAKLKTLVGTWLSRAPDRDRGRAKRLQQALEERQDI